DPDVSAAAIFRSGLDAGAELAARLGIDGGHVVTGHTHRGGPLEGEEPWRLPGGGRLHNTGNWIFASVFHHPGPPPRPYCPATLAGGEGPPPPRRVRLLTERSHEELTQLIERASTPATRR